MTDDYSVDKTYENDFTRDTSYNERMDDTMTATISMIV